MIIVFIKFFIFFFNREIDLQFCGKQIPKAIDRIDGQTPIHWNQFYPMYKT